MEKKKKKEKNKKFPPQWKISHQNKHSNWTEGNFSIDRIGSLFLRVQQHSIYFLIFTVRAAISITSFIGNKQGLTG